jgi:CDP-glucose 4,6-dehydratase
LKKGPHFSESFNFGPDEKDAKNVEWIAGHLVKTWGEGAAYEIVSNASSLHEAHFLKLDCSKAHHSIELATKMEY